MTRPVLGQRAQEKNQQKVTMTCKCIRCGKKREIQPGEIHADDVPFCDVCFMPMVAVSAKRQ